MGIATAIAVGAGVSAIGGAVASNQAKKAAARAGRAQSRAQAEINALKSKRPKPINPYSSTKDLSEMAKDLSGQLTNAFSNLGVATQAAEIQMERQISRLQIHLIILELQVLALVGQPLLHKQHCSLRKV